MSSPASSRVREAREGGGEPIWMERILVDAIHADLLESFGGLAGVRDENALESALARPRNREEALAEWLRGHMTEAR